MNFSQHDVQKMIELLASAADPTIDLPLAQRKRLLVEGVAKLVDADAWIWSLSRVNPQVQGDAMYVQMIDGGWRDAHERAKVFEVISHPKLQSTATAPLEQAVRQGISRTISRDQIMDDEVWDATEAGKAWRTTGFHEFILLAYPLGHGMISALGFHRRQNKPAFTSREREIVHVFFQQVDWLHREGANVPVSPNVVELSPRERQVVLLLMGGDSCKQVANKLRLSHHTVNDYMKDIYRKLEVKSRAELLAKFIPSG